MSTCDFRFLEVCAALHPGSLELLGKWVCSRFKPLGASQPTDPQFN